jgi:hypothetical protein
MHGLRWHYKHGTCERVLYLNGIWFASLCSEPGHEPLRYFVLDSPEGPYRDGTEHQADHANRSANWQTMAAALPLSLRGARQLKTPMDNQLLSTSSRHVDRLVEAGIDGQQARAFSHALDQAR